MSSHSSARVPTDAGFSTPPDADGQSPVQVTGWSRSIRAGGHIFSVGRFFAQAPTGHDGRPDNISCLIPDNPVGH